MQKWIDWFTGLSHHPSETLTTSVASHKTQDNSEARILVELEDLRRREKALIERAVDVVCTINSNGSFVFVSPSSKSAWGYTAREIQGQSVQLVVDEVGYKRILAYAGEADKSIERVTFETEIRCQDGSIKHAAWRGQWSISEKTLFCIVHDITEQKQVEQALRTSERQLKEILESLPAGVLIMTDSNTVEFANAASRRLLGRDESQIIGQSEEKLFVQEIPAHLWRLDQKDRITARADGSLLPVETHSDTIELGGRIKQLLLFVDKSAHYELERAKQEFFAMVAHDFRAPLTSLRNLVILIEDGVLDKQSVQGTRVSEQVNLECTQLLRLVQDMVDIGKMGSNTFVLDNDHNPTAGAIQSAVEGIKFIAEQENISISLPQTNTTYWGDELRINQVLTNLLTNAIKHSSPGSNVKIQVSENSENNCVRFAVQDFGPGIPAEKLDRVFEIYEQLAGATGKVSQGTGLGLAICKMIVQRHGGQIGVESTPGVGSTFWFTIPKSPVSDGLLH